MHDDHALIGALAQRLTEIREAQGIRHLNELRPDGKHPLTYYHEVTGGHARLRPFSIFLYDDFFAISNDLVHFTSLLYLLRPYINDPTQEEGTYFQTWPDVRYLSYASVLASAVYNFWDRVGDLLSYYFETGLRDANTYVGRVLNNFPAAHRKAPEFVALNEAYETKVRQIIGDRNDDAHNRSLAARRYYEVVLADKSAHPDLVEVRRHLPEQFKEQIDLANAAFKQALRLIDERAPEK